MSRRRGSCPGCDCARCPGYCLAHGSSHSPCGVEAALFYNIGGYVGPPNPENECCELPDDYLLREDSGTAGVCVSGTACWWLDNEGSEICQWVLYICSDDEAYVFVYLPSKDAPVNVIVWKAADGYDPLCPSIFIYDPDHPLDDPPEDCEWWDQLCVGGNNGCCDDEREEAMPDTLYASFTYCCEDTPDLTADFTMSWNPATGRWEGGATLCNGRYAAFTIRCICGALAGCGGVGAECYRATVVYAGVDLQDEAVEDCVCDPFQGWALFPTLMVDAGLCSAEAMSGGLLAFTE